MARIVRAFTDGACSGNPGGPGGWSAVIPLSERIHVIKGGEFSTNSNRMEMVAIIKALQEIKSIFSEAEGMRIEIHTDSAYIANAVNKGMVKKWELCGWKTKGKLKGKVLEESREIQNSQLWKMMLKEMHGFNVRIIKVKGHSGNTFNEQADKEAKGVLEEYR